MLSLVQKGKILLGVLLAFGSYQVMSEVMVRTLTGDEARVRNFYLEEENSLDMVIVGASTAYTDYSAPLAWKEFGITSYSLATNSAPMGLAKSMLKEVRKYQNPKVILIDINGILYDDAGETNENNIRRWIDNMKFSKNKIDTINELIPTEQRMNYFVPLMKYHARWKDIGECLEAFNIERENKKDPSHLVVLGDEGMSGMVAQHPIKDVTNYRQKTVMYQKSGESLIALLDYCKTENLKNIVFTNMPRFYSSTKMIQEKERFNEAKEKIAEYGYPCIDLDDYVKEIGLDPETDFYNANHLNVYGQRKNTRFLIQKLMETYDLTSTHNETVTKRWNEEYRAYEKVQAWVENKIKAGKSEHYTFMKINKIIHDEME